MDIDTAVRALGALAQSTRLAVFRGLVRAGPAGLSVGEIGEALSVPPATLSFHLKELSYAGLIAPRKNERYIFYSANFESMAALMAYLTENCCQGMPEKCIVQMESALSGCCAPAKKRAPSKPSKERTHA